MDSHISTACEYGRLFEESPMPMYIYESAGFRFLAVNKAALSQYHYSLEEFMQLTALDIYPVEDRATFIASNLNVPETYSDKCGWLHRRRNGDIIYVNIFAHVILFEGKKAVCVMAVDMDEKLKMQELLRSKAADVEEVLNSITDACYSLNHKWEFTYINSAYEKLMKRKREDLIGKNIWELFPYARKLSYYEQYNHAVKEQVNVHFEEYIPTHRFWVSVTAYPSAKGLTVYFMDITEQRKLREQKLKDERNLRAIIDNTKDIIWLVDREFNLIAANNAFRERVTCMMGKPASEIVKSDYAPEVLQTWHMYYHKALEGELIRFIWKAEYSNQTIYEEVSFNPVFSENNQVAAISCFSRDITQARHYELKIKRQNMKLRDIAMLQSHQVRAPLANIKGLLQLFNSVNDLGQNQEIIDMLKVAAEQMDIAIHDIVEHVELYEETII